MTRWVAALERWGMFRARGLVDWRVRDIKDCMAPASRARWVGNPTTRSLSAASREGARVFGSAGLSGRSLSEGRSFPTCMGEVH